MIGRVDVTVTVGETVGETLVETVGETGDAAFVGVTV